VILDLSFPAGNSVNDFISKDGCRTLRTTRSFRT
jgi:hypothetical protein